MLREKSKIDTDEHKREMNLSYKLIKSESSENLISECYTGKDGENRTYWQNVVKMSHHVICVVQGNIKGTISQYNARHSPNREKKKET